MCGVTAVITLAGRPRKQASRDHHVQLGVDDSTKLNSVRDKLDSQLIESLASIQHRGPDSSGKWISANGLVGQSLLRCFPSRFVLHRRHLIS